MTRMIVEDLRAILEQLDGVGEGVCAAHLQFVIDTLHRQSDERKP